MRVRAYGVHACALVLVLVSAPAWAQQDIDPRLLAYPESIVYNGKILTADDQFTIVEAVAIRDGKFLARGTSAEMLRLAGPKTDRIDLQGRTAVPGFIESHSHGWLGQSLKRGPEGGLVFMTLEQGLSDLKQAVSNEPPGELLQFIAARTEAGLNATRWDLDKVTPDNPVLISFDTYNFIANSLALKMVLDYLGEDAERFGVVKDPKTGEFTGLIQGMASGILGYEILPWPDIEELEPLEIARLKEYHTEGTTMLIGRAPGAQITMLRNIKVKGELPIRVRLTHEFLRDHPNPEAALKRMGSLIGIGDDWFKFIGTSVQYPDGPGQLTSKRKLRLAPDDVGGWYGVSRWEKYSNARESILLAARYGWTLTSMHSKGDQSVRMLLEAYQEAEASRGGPVPGARWVIDHNPHSAEDTVALMKKLNVIPSVYAWWGMSDRNMDPSRVPGRDPTAGRPRIPREEKTDALLHAPVYAYGADAMHRNWSLARTFIDAGLKPVIENYGEGPHVPVRHLWAFITRTDRQGIVWAPEERVSRPEALWMKTRWAAYISGDEDKLGSIEEGKLADMAVLDGDYLTVPEEEIESLRVVMTMINGNVVYERNK